jgi:thymidylate kinase
VGALIRDSFEGKAQIDPRAMMWLFVAEAKDMERRITDWLTAGESVVCDRHTLISGYIYQGQTHDVVDVDRVTKAAHLRQHDRVYLLDAPIEVSLVRRGARGEARNALYEDDDLFKLQVKRMRYLEYVPVLATDTYKILDATLPIEENVNLIMSDLWVQ